MCNVWVTDKEKRKRREYLLPSIRLPGRGLPLNMAAAHPKARGLRKKKRCQKREERKGTVTVHHREQRDLANGEKEEMNEDAILIRV